MDIWAVSSFRLLWLKPCWLLPSGFWVVICLHFSGVNPWDAGPWAPCAVTFLRNCKVFSMLCSFCLRSICVCFDQSEFSSLPSIALVVHLSRPNVCKALSVALTAFPWWLMTSGISPCARLPFVCSYVFLDSVSFPFLSIQVTGSLVMWVSCKCCSYILQINLDNRFWWGGLCFLIIFSQSVATLCFSLTASLKRTEVFNFDEVQFFRVFFFPPFSKVLAFLRSKNFLLDPRLPRVFSYVFCGCFIVLRFIFRSAMCFEFNFINSDGYGRRWNLPCLWLLSSASPVFPPHHFDTFDGNQLTICVAVFLDFLICSATITLP